MSEISPPATAPEGASPAVPAAPAKRAKTPPAKETTVDLSQPPLKLPDASSAEQVAALRQAGEERVPVEGTVIGWNKGGFHVVLGRVTAFCPLSEMELGKARAPKVYMDKSFLFAVLRVQKKGRRVVLSRAAYLRAKQAERKAEVRRRVHAGAILDGKVASLTDFGAFVDLKGAQGLVHVSEISRQRVDDPRVALTVGQKVKVKVLKVEQGGKRISLSMKALEPDPWEGIAKRFEEGSVVRGTVERTAPFGAFVALAPGLTGLLPTSGMNLPRGASPARVFAPGKQLSVQIMRVDPRRRRISLALEGSTVEGTRADFERYVKGQKRSQGFTALAAALEKLRKKPK